MNGGRICLLVAGICLVALGVGIVGPVAADDGGERATNETTDLEIDPAVAAADGETTVIVRLEGRPEAEVTGTATENQVAAMQSHANETQIAFERFAGENPHVEIERQFWLANAIEATVDTDQVSLERMGAVDNVVGLEPDVKVEAHSTAAATNPGSTADAIDSTTTSDSYTYGLETIGAPEVWDEFEAKGDGVTVAVLDSGVDDEHDDIDVHAWKDFDSTPSSEPKDYGEHGTHVSGTIVGGDASGTHIGVAPEAELMHGAVLTNCNDSGCFGSGAAILDGMQWAVANDADVLSMSLGTGTYSDSYIDTVRNAEAAGTTVVASIGNDGEGTSGSPGNVYESFAIGASSQYDNVASFSGGEEIDKYEAWGSPPYDWPNEYVVPNVVAPGVSVESSVPGNEWEHWRGTSMAAPHVSGAIALLHSSTDEDLTPAEIKTLFESTAVDIGEESHRQGEGRIDAFEALITHSRDTIDPEFDLETANVSESTTISVDVDHPIDTYQWEVDGEPIGTTGEPAIDHEFEELGTADVQIAMEDVGGETIEVTTQVDVVDEIPPIANFETDRTDDIEVGLETVELDASESTDNYQVDHYEWTIDGEHVETTNASTIEYTFTDVGTRTVELAVVDAAGNENTTTTDLEVVDTTAPTVSLDAPEEPVVNTAATFDASESTDNHEIEGYQWTFGDGTSENTSDPVTTHVFDETGERTLTLTASDPAGNTETTESTFTVRNPPSAGIESPADGTAIAESNVTIDYELADTDIENAAALEYRVDDADAPGDEPVVDWTAGPFNATAAGQSFAVHTGDRTDGNYTVRVRLLDDEGDVLPYDTATDEVDLTIKTTPPALDVDVQRADQDFPSVGPANPAIVNVTTTDHRHESTTIAVTDSEGELVTEWDRSNETGDGETVTIEWPSDDAVDSIASGEYEITATAIDDLGNENRTSTTMTVDTDEPTIAVDSIEGVAEHEEVVYVNETTGLALEGTAGDGQSESGPAAEVSVVLDSASTNYQNATSATLDEAEGVWTATIDPAVLPDEGAYHVHAEVTDRAKNQHRTTVDESTEYDRTAPRLSTVITDYDEGMDEATVEIRSDDPLDSEPTIEVVKPDGNDFVLQDLTENAATEWTGTFDVTDGGPYDLNATGTDLAGNQETETASATIDPATPVDDRMTVYNDRTGTFVRINTTAADEIDETFVTLSETQPSPYPLESDVVGVEFLTTALGSDLDDAVANATIGIPTNESQLPDGVAVDDDRVSLQWYDESRTQWEERNLTVQDFDPNGGEPPVEGEYWTATVDELSTYGVTVVDDGSPKLVDVTPADGDTIDHDTESVSIEFDYEDDISGVNVSSIDLHVDGERVTDDDSTQITSSTTSYEPFAVESGESYNATLEIVDEAGNEDVFETGFEVATDESDGGTVAPPSLEPDDTDGPEPTAVISIDPDPATVGEDVTFSAADSVDEERPIVGYEWTIDGETFGGERVTTAFDETGEYDVELTVENDLGESDTTAATVTVEEDDSPTEEEPAVDDEGSDEETEPTDAEESDDDSIPGFGLPVAIAAVLSIALLALRRDR